MLLRDFFCRELSSGRPPGKGEEKASEGVPRETRPTEKQEQRKRGLPALAQVLGQKVPELSAEVLQRTVQEGSGMQVLPCRRKAGTMLTTKKYSLFTYTRIVTNYFLHLLLL